MYIPDASPEVFTVMLFEPEFADPEYTLKPVISDSVTSAPLAASNDTVNASFAGLG